MKRESTKLLLDTHVWIWYVSGGELLQRSGVLSLIEQAAHRSDIYVSAISVWEVGMLEATRGEFHSRWIVGSG